MNLEQVQAELIQLRQKLNNKFNGSAPQRKIWRTRAAFLNKILFQLKPNTQNAKNSFYPRTSHR